MSDIAGGAATAPPGPPPDPRLFRGARLKLAASLAVLFVGGVAASSLRIASIPGIEWYLGPFFYLLAVRRWGLWAGLAAAVLTMSATLVWWGHPFSIVLALAHVLLAHRFGRGTLLAPLTLGFAVVVHPLVAFPLLTSMHAAPTDVILLVVGRKIVNDVVCATLVDLILVQFRLFEDGRVIQPRRPVRLVHYFRTWSHLGLMAILAVAFNSGVEDFRENFNFYRSEQVRHVSAALRAPGAPEVSGAPRVLADGYPGGKALASSSEAALQIGMRAGGLGCATRIAHSERLKAFDEILANCTTTTIGDQPGERIFVLTSDREPAVRAYAGTLDEVTPIAVVALMLAVALALIQRDIERNLGNWAGLLAAFGREKLAPPSGSRFAEFSAPLNAFVDANNAYVESEAARVERMEHLKVLRGAMGLSLLRDITYDQASGVIHCLEYSPGSSLKRAIKVHPDDRAMLERALHREFTVEFRTEGKDRDWLLMYGGGRRPDGSFERGLSFRLRQPRMAVTLMRQRARLQDIGLSVASTTHELQQPLFVITLGAEQGVAIAESPADLDRGALRALFERILGQARRAQGIVDRVSRRAHAQDGLFHDGSVPLAQVLEDVLDDTVRYADRSGAGIQVDNTVDPKVHLRIDRTSLEQVLINAIRNAVDATAERAKTTPGRGNVWIRTSRGRNGELCLAVEDDGIGLTAEAGKRVFDAFYTTKPPGAGTGLGLFIARDLVEEWGGAISLGPRPGGGGVLAFTIPAGRVSG